MRETDERKARRVLFQVDFSKLSPIFIFFESCLIDVFFDEEFKFVEKKVSYVGTFRAIFDFRKIFQKNRFLGRS